MNLLDFLFLREQRTSYQRALQYERSRHANGAQSQSEVFAEAARQLAGNPAISFGRLPDDTPVGVDQSIALASALVIGATGSGKTRFILGLIFGLLRRLFQMPDEPHLLDPPLDIELELVDPKQETFAIASEFIAALWLLADDATKERIARAVRVIDWSPDAVSPIAPFDNAAADVSDAYLASDRGRLRPRGGVEHLRRLPAVLDGSVDHQQVFAVRRERNGHAHHRTAPQRAGLPKSHG